MKVQLAPGRALRDPTTKQHLKPDEVRTVSDSNLYWRRRLRDGDVVEVAADAPAQHRRTAAAAKE